MANHERELGRVLRLISSKAVRAAADVQAVAKPAAPTPTDCVACRVGDASCAKAHASNLGPVQATGRAATQDALLRLQRRYGNRYVRRVLRLQRKLTVGAVDDEQEREAENVARQVMRMAAPQRADDDEEALAARTVPLDEETEAAVGESGGFEPGGAFEARLDSSRGGGNPLPAAVRHYMEPRFGVGFGDVRVHTDDEAARLSRDIDAKAFTHGADIYYGAGHGPGDLELTAHELTHVVQQAGGATRAVRRTLGDGHDLTSPRFANDAVLEACFDNERLLSVGARGEAVSKLQQALVDAGFPLPRFGVDGIFGDETRTAVRDFQRGAAIGIDGIVGPQTMGALDARFAGPPAPPAPAPPAPAPPAPAPPAPAPPAPAPPAPAPPAPAPPAPAPPPTITSQTVETTPGLRTRTTIGTGERVDLTKSGAAAWSTTAGTLSATTGATVRLTAPDTAQTVTVTAGAASLAFTVIAPSSVHMDRFPGTGIRHAQNFPDSGIRTRPFLGPDTVNFSRVQYHEVDIGAVANGTYACHNGTGHDASPATLTLSSTVVAGKGTQTNAMDTVYSGHCGGTAPFTPGSLSFAIPYEYKVGTGAFRRFATVNQVHVLAADGSTLTTDKASAHGDTTVTAPTSAF